MPAPYADLTRERPSTPARRRLSLPIPALTRVIRPLASPTSSIAGTSRAPSVGPQVDPSAVVSESAVDRLPYPFVARQGYNWGGSLLASGWSTTGDRPVGSMPENAVRLGEQSKSSQGVHDARLARVHR